MTPSSTRLSLAASTTGGCCLSDTISESTVCWSSGSLLGRAFALEDSPPHCNNKKACKKQMSMAYENKRILKTKENIDTKAVHIWHEKKHTSAAARSNREALTTFSRLSISFTTASASCSYLAHLTSWECLN